MTSKSTTSLLSAHHLELELTRWDSNESNESDASQFRTCSRTGGPNQSHAEASRRCRKRCNNTFTISAQKHRVHSCESTNGVGFARKQNKADRCCYCHEGLERGVGRQMWSSPFEATELITGLLTIWPSNTVNPKGSLQHETSTLVCLCDVGQA